MCNFITVDCIKFIIVPAATLSLPYYANRPFTKLHKLVHNGGFPKFEAPYYSQNPVISIKILGESESCNRFWMYPSLSTSLLLGMHYDIENTSMGRGFCILF